MVKSIRRYTEESERQRVRHLRQLTYRESAAILELFLRSRLVFELHFADDDHPVALARRYPPLPRHRRGKS